MSFPTHSQGSFRKGISFVFHDGANTILVWGSSFSGKEKVYLNEQLVAETRRMKMNGEHTFKDYAGNLYTVKILTTNALKGVIECHLYKNETAVMKYECRYRFGSMMNKKFLMALFGGSIAIGVLGGLGYLNLTSMGLLLALLLIVLFRVFESEAFAFTTI